MKIHNLSRFDELLAALNESFVLISVMKTQFKKMFLKKTNKQKNTFIKIFFFCHPKCFGCFQISKCFLNFLFNRISTTFADAIVFILRIFRMASVILKLRLIPYIFPNVFFFLSDFVISPFVIYPLHIK